MATRSNLLKLFKYHADLLVTCPQCLSLDPMSLADFRKKHVKEVHCLTLTECEFCLGAFRWKPGTRESASTVQHQRSCFKTFRTECKYIPAPQEPLPDQETGQESSTMGVCEPCKNFDASALKLSMFGREPVPVWKSWGFYDPIFRQPSWWKDPDIFPLNEDCGLGTDTAVMFKRFEEFKWFHVCVKPFAFSHFKKDLKDLSDHFAVLPYECLCDGLETQHESEQRHHRHMIIAVKLAYEQKFRKIWIDKIHSPQHKYTLGKGLREIKTRQHLAAAICYVGQQRSSCDAKKLNESPTGLLSHYWINRPVYPHGELAMCCLYPGGLQEYVLYRNRVKLVLPWIHFVQLNEQQQYAVPLKATNLPVKNCVVPVRHDLKPWKILENNQEDHPYKLWMYEEEKCLVFQEHPEWLGMSKDEWYEQQKTAGNCFLEAIINSLYVLTFAQAKTIRQLKQLERDHQRMKRKMKREIDQLKQENAKLKEEKERLKQENERLKEILNI